MNGRHKKAKDACLQVSVALGEAEAALERALGNLSEAQQAFQHVETALDRAFSALDKPRKGKDNGK